jgi:hypothetical protein
MVELKRKLLRPTSPWTDYLKSGGNDRGQNPITPIVANQTY